MKPGFRRWGRRSLSLGLTTMVAAVVLCVTAASSWADDDFGGFLRTTTSAVTSVDAISVDQSATITATVTWRLPFGPFGRVEFYDATNNTPLGTARLSRCRWGDRSCKPMATITVPGTLLSPGGNVILVRYQGNEFFRPSGTTVNLDQGTATACTSDGSQCSTGFVSSPDTFDNFGSPHTYADARITDTTQTSGPDQTIVLTFSHQQLGCSDSTMPETASWTVTNPGTRLKRVEFNLYGRLADAWNARHGVGYICYDSSNQFVTATGGPATPQPDGSFAGILPQCTPGIFNADLTPRNPPCVLADSTYSPAGDGPSDYYVDFVVTPGDPRAGG